MSAKFSIPEPRMPTLAEHQATSAKWWAFSGPTFYDQWPEDLRALSAATKMVPVSAETADCMPAWFYEGSHAGEPRPKLIDDLAGRLDEAMDWREHFIKLNSRSPKDVTDPGLPITNAGRQALSWLNGSMRCIDDLLEFSYLPPEKCGFVLCREPRHYSRKTEIRAFIKDRQVIASTVYHFNDAEVMSEWAASGSNTDYAQAVMTYLEQRVIPACHLSTFVADVAVSLNGRDGPELIEINPYGSSHPCLFASYAEIEAWLGGLKTAPTEPTP